MSTPTHTPSSSVPESAQGRAESEPKPSRNRAESEPKPSRDRVETEANSGRNMPSDRRLSAHYILIQVIFWAMFGAFCAYMTTLLLHRGFTNTQIGFITAVRCFTGVIAQPILGSFADKHSKIPVKWILSVCLALSFFAGVLLLWDWDFWLTTLLYGIVGALEITAYPLIDSMAVQFIQAGADVPYSLGRGLGSFSYAVLCVVLGSLTARFSPQLSLYFHSAFVLLLIGAVATFPTFRREWGGEGTGEGAKPTGAFKLLRDNPRFTLMLVGILLGITAVMPMSNFLVNIIRARGGDQQELGVALFLMAAFELPAAVLFTKLYRRGRAAALLVGSMFFMGVKAVVMLMAPNYHLIWVCEAVQMLGYGIFTPASVFYVSDTIAPADQVKGQTLMMVASNGLGGMLSGFLAGRVLDTGGVDAMLALCAALAFCATAVTALAAFPRKKKA